MENVLGGYNLDVTIFYRFSINAETSFKRNKATQSKKENKGKRYPGKY